MQSRPAWIVHLPIDATTLEAALEVACRVAWAVAREVDEADPYGTAVGLANPTTMPSIVHPVYCNRPVGNRVCWLRHQHVGDCQALASPS